MKNNKPNCKQCGVLKTPDNTTIHTRGIFETNCKKCKAKNAKIKYGENKKNGIKVKTRHLNDEEFREYVKMKNASREKAIDKSFDPIGANEYTTQFTSERQRDAIKTRPVWNDEELDIVVMARMANKPSAYIDYIQAKVNKEL